MPTVRYGYNGATVAVDKFVLLSMWRQLHPEMQRRMMAAIIATGYTLGVGSTFRPAQSQIDLFLSRNVRSATPTGTYWNGTYWALKAGAAYAAIPGESYHEPCIGPDGQPDSTDTSGLCVAIDTLNLVESGLDGHLAQFGLRNFTGEKWHVQPVEWPAKRADWNAHYEPLQHWPLPGDQPPPTPPTEDDMKTQPHPTRVYDSRSNGGALQAGEIRTVNLLANVVGVNITVTGAANAGYLTAWGADPRPPTSNVQFPAGGSADNYAQIALGPGGLLHFAASSACHVIIDLQAAGA